MLNRPMTRPRIVGRRVELHQRLRHGVERELEEAGGEQQRQRERIGGGERKPASADAPSMASMMAVRGFAGSRPRPSSTTPASSAPAASAASSML